LLLNNFPEMLWYGGTKQWLVASTVQITFSKFEHAYSIACQ
jgi:hypothetical protein